MLIQSADRGRQDRRKIPEHAQQQAGSLARLFALKAAFLLHYALFFNEGRGHK